MSISHFAVSDEPVSMVELQQVGNRPPKKRRTTARADQKDAPEAR